MEKDSNKKVKFAFDPLIDAVEDEQAGPSDGYDEETNDLDLDTIRASARSSSSRGLKEFDSEGSDDDQDQEEELNFNSDDSSENGEELERESSKNHDIENSEEDERGVPIVPFNLKSDKEEGCFDADGFYTRKVDEDADQDRWMANLTASDISSARKAHEKREKELKMVEEGKQRRSEVDLYAELAGLMEDSGNDASVLDVLRSLKSSNESTFSKPSAPLNKNRLKKLAKEQQSNNNKSNDNNKQDLISIEDKAKLERITELADALMDYGNFGVYEETRRQILYKLNKK